MSSAGKPMFMFKNTHKNLCDEESVEEKRMEEINVKYRVKQLDKLRNAAKQSKDFFFIRTQQLKNAARNGLFEVDELEENLLETQQDHLEAEESVTDLKGQKETLVKISSEKEAQMLNIRNNFDELKKHHGETLESCQHELLEVINKNGIERSPSSWKRLKSFFHLGNTSSSSSSSSSSLRRNQEREMKMNEVLCDVINDFDRSVKHSDDYSY